MSTAATEPLEVDERELARGRVEIPAGAVSAGEERDRGGGGSIPPPPPDADRSRKGGGRPERPPLFQRLMLLFAWLAIGWVLLEWTTRPRR